jgi:ankyrin repeat protein
VDVNLRDVYGETLLIDAVKWDRGGIEVVEFLVQSGAEINAVDNEGRSAFYYAIWGENPEIAQYLLDAGSECHCGISGAAEFCSCEEGG